jgi:hypothetical protein
LIDEGEDAAPTTTAYDCLPVNFDGDEMPGIRSNMPIQKTGDDMDASGG